MVLITEEPDDDDVCCLMQNQSLYQFGNCWELLYVKTTIVFFYLTFWHIQSLELTNASGTSLTNQWGATKSVCPARPCLANHNTYMISPARQSLYICVTGVVREFSKWLIDWHWHWHRWSSWKRSFKTATYTEHGRPCVDSHQEIGTYYSRLVQAPLATNQRNVSFWHLRSSTVMLLHTSLISFRATNRPEP